MGKNSYYEQAPQLLCNGEKMQDHSRMGKAIRTHELEAAIANCLGERDFVAYKVMMFYTGNAEGFRVAEKTVLSRCNISARAYVNARKKLADMHWITDIKGESITVNYNKIFADYRNKLAAKEDAFNASLEKTGINAGMHSIHPDQLHSFPKGGCIERIQGGCTEYSHNNINNNINDNIKKDNDNKVKNFASLRSAPSITPDGRDGNLSFEEIRKNKVQNRAKRKELEQELEEAHDSYKSFLSEIFNRMSREQWIAYKNSDEFLLIEDKYRIQIAKLNEEIRALSI